MSDLHYEMLAFHDELVKQGAPPAFEVAKRIIGRLRPQGVLEAAHLGARGARTAADFVGRGAQSAGKAVSDFGKRQLHGMTGWTPKAGLESIGFQGSKATQKALEAAQAAPLQRGGTGVLQKAMHGRQAGTRGLAERVKERSVARAQKLHEAAKAHEAMGLTSLPGWAKGLATKPGEALRAGLGKEWHSGTMGKAMVGLPLAAAGHQLATPSEAGGPGRLERAGKSLGEIGWSMGLPLTPAIVAASAIGRGGGAAGRLVDKFVPGQGKKRKPELGKNPAPPTMDAGGQTQPAERIMTPSAMGRPPEDMIT